VLDHAYNSNAEIPHVLEGFAAQCVQGAQQDPKYCPFATNSLTALDPALDLYERIEAVLSCLATRTYISSNVVFSFSKTAFVIREFLMSVGYFPYLANHFLNAENLIQDQTGSDPPRSSIAKLSMERDSTAVNATTVNSTITTAGWDPWNPLTGGSNHFVLPAVICLDKSYTNIDTPVSFGSYLYKQIQEQPLIGFLGGALAFCLGWPNLTDYGAETIYAENFPRRLANKMLVIGVTGDPVTPYPGALKTYEFIGNDNAVFLIHEAMGHCSISNPNDCTYDAVTSYFVDGTNLLYV
jgi:TAP-like protein